MPLTNAFSGSSPASTSPDRRLSERALADRKALAAVVLEPHPSIEWRDGVGADPVVLAELPAQRDPEAAPSALSVVPLVRIVGLSGRTIQRPMPASMALIVVFSSVT